jgi:formamidopyrimidine-DNA glycosylase
MPERSECRIIAEGLDVHLRNATIEGLRVLSGRYASHGVPKGMVPFEARLPLRCLGVGVKGKFIFLKMADGSSIWSTLGMSGSWVTQPRSHARFEIVSSRSGFTQSVYFVDPRNFGTLTFSLNAQELDRKLASLGLDLLNDTSVSAYDVTKIIRRPRCLRKTLAEILMDQSCFAGVGNYVKAEALYRARLSPHRTAGSLNDHDIERLHVAVAQVLREAYEARGMTRRDYQDLRGEPGMFTFKLRVYNRRIDPDGNPVVTETTRDGRTTHWVPAVQL